MLTEVAFQTDTVPRPDRFAFWRECMARTMAPMEISSPRPDDFWARQRLLYLEDSWLWPVSLSASRYRRTPRLIRQSDPELLHMTLLLPGSGTIHVDHGGHRSTNGACDIYFLDTSRPYDVRSDDHEHLVGVGVEIPRSRLPLPRGKSLDDVPGRRLSGRRGFGALLAQFVTHVCEETTSYRSTDAPRLNGMLLDLVAGLLSHELGTDDVLPPETRTRNLVLAIRSFILRNLHDPRLTAESVAEAHHVSPRHLHRMFQHEGVTVAALIRRQRLERARRELADPALHGTPVHAIATRCGFTAAAHFSRAFRTAYGVSPREFRQGERARTAGREVVTTPALPAQDRVLDPP
ncbi:helix-turn-helix domain-containing protein [Streptomyces sp. CC210A]|uniref:helix-turn-helix domain-containing protein n=1 Tax=Streptomyces sp. CC210A TaxID=2898184 RepID=UPI001F3A6AFB|nr:helix-turn-helix domain-containing protein [Streptomyces sp. CC210A]